MIQLIVEYLWHEAHGCFEITESLIKLLGADLTRDGWNTWGTHLRACSVTPNPSWIGVD
jgi:hypothetical protein